MYIAVASNLGRQQQHHHSPESHHAVAGPASHREGAQGRTSLGCAGEQYMHHSVVAGAHRIAAWGAGEQRRGSTGCQVPMGLQHGACALLGCQCTMAIDPGQSMLSRTAKGVQARMYHCIRCLTPTDVYDLQASRELFQRCSGGSGWASVPMVGTRRPTGGATGAILSAYLPRESQGDAGAEHEREGADISRTVCNHLEQCRVEISRGTRPVGSTQRWLAAVNTRGLERNF